jgi:hypothetical protein
VPATSESADFIGNTNINADDHQQYLATNPNGYGGIGGCVVAYAYSPKELPDAQKA